jgi:hypothetical protein
VGNDFNPDVIFIHADKKFNYGKGFILRLDGGIIKARDGMARLHDQIIELVHESSCDAVVIMCFMGGDSSFGLRNLINRIRVSNSRVFLISSRPFTSAGRKVAYTKECLVSVVDLLNGIYLLDMQEVLEYLFATKKAHTMREFFQFCDDPWRNKWQ